MSFQIAPSIQPLRSDRPCRSADADRRKVSRFQIAAQRGRIPLTPALSRGERENRPPRNGESNSLGRAGGSASNRGITADTALRLARYFATTVEPWTGLQADYDLRRARYAKQRQIERDVELLATSERSAA